jgi:hypothetical protein
VRRNKITLSLTFFNVICLELTKYFLCVLDKPSSCLLLVVVVTRLLDCFARLVVCVVGGLRGWWIAWLVVCEMTNGMSRVAVPVPRKRRRDEGHYVHSHLYSHVYSHVDSHVDSHVVTSSKCILSANMQQQQQQQQQQQVGSTCVQGPAKVLKACL